MVAFAAGYVIEHVYSRKKYARHGMPIGLRNEHVTALKAKNQVE